jgi:hypothetical protein
MDLTKNGTTDNTLPYTATIQLSSSGGTLTTGAVNINFDFTDIKFKSMFGYIGQHSISIPRDSVDLEIYTHAFAGQAYFEDPKIHLKVNNSYGVPIRLNFTDFGAYSRINNTLYNFTLPSDCNPLDIAAPNITQVGQVIPTLRTLNKTNTPNLNNAMSNLPRYVFYGVQAQVNPVSTVNNNFVVDDSKFDVDVEVELPIWGTANYMALQDTGKFDFKDVVENIGDVQWAMFRLNVTNGFPTEVGVQVYFTDSVFNVVDSLFNETKEIIKSGAINSDGKVIQSTLKTTDVVFNRERFKKLSPVRYVLIRGHASTTNSGLTNVKVYSNYTVEAQVAVQVQIDADLN